MNDEDDFEATESKLANPMKKLDPIQSRSYKKISLKFDLILQLTNVTDLIGQLQHRV